MAEDRRAFLTKLAKGSIYSVPVIRTLATPPELVGMAAQMCTKTMDGMGGGMGGGMFVAPTPTPGGGGSGRSGSTAPWARPPGM